MRAEEAFNVVVKYGFCGDCRWDFEDEHCMKCYCYQSVKFIKEALETISELEKRGITVDVINEYKTFEDECVSKGFSFKSLLEAREKQIPKKPEKEAEENLICPLCGSFLGYELECREEPYQCNYCAGCGQAIDWNEV